MADEHTAHFCHWTGCKTEVRPSLFMCLPHWLALPKPIRRRIWAAYRSGQEIRKDPSPEYIAAASEAREWIYANHREVPNEQPESDSQFKFAI